MGTARTYAGRLALWMTWATASGAEVDAPDVDALTAFALWLERAPSRKHRSERDRRRAPDPIVVPLGPARSPSTVDGIVAVVVELVRFGASRGWTGPASPET